MAPTKGGRTTRSAAKQRATNSINNTTTRTTTTTNGVRVNQESLRVTTTKRTTESVTNKSSRRRTAESSICNMSMYSQSDATRKEENVIYFVLPEDLTPATCSPTLARTYMYAQAQDIKSQWMTAQDCLDLVPKPGNMFIADPFEGPIYERLLGYKIKGLCYLLGPQVLQHLLQNDDKSPELDMGGSTPFFTVGMRNLLICLTGFLKDQKVELPTKITKMLGTCSPSLTKGVTHVVAFNLMTEKVLKAYETNIPVMMAEWIDAVWDDSQNDLVHAVDEKYVKYACPIFHKLVVCVSQVDVKLKGAIRDVIEANGGKYSADLTKAKTSILIIPLAVGEKYKFAREWKVPCATPDWVEASKSAGHIVSWKDYPVPKPYKDHPPTSTPCNSMMLPQLHVPSNTDDSILSNINGPALKDRHVVSQYEYTEENLKQAVELIKTMSEPFLDGCQIYICNNQKSEYVRKLVNAGAIRLSKISDRVTHIILPPNNQLNTSELNQFKQLDPRPCLMKVQWLIDSAKQGSATDEESHRINIDSNGAYVMMNQVSRVAESIIINQSSHHASDHLAENIRSEVSTSSENNGGVSDIGSPPKNNSSNKNESNQLLKMDVNQAKSHSHGSPVNPDLDSHVGCKDLEARYYVQDGNEENENIGCENGMNLDDDEHVAEAEMVNLNESEQKLFSGLKFKVEMNRNQRIEIEKTLTDNGGKLSSGADYDFLIVPTLYTPKTGEVHLRTKQWVNDCIDNDTVADGDSFYFYKPRKPFSGMGSIFVGVVVAISQYTNSEKEYISELVNKMGGMFQDMFARKTVNAVYRTTHLICAKTDSDKYIAAQKWKTPVVVAEWVVESFEKKVILDIGLFDPVIRSDSQSTVNYLPQTPVVNSSRAQKVPQMERNRKVSQLQQVASVRQHAPPTSPEKAQNNHVFKTPTSKPRKSMTASTPAATKPNVSLNEEIQQTDSFIEWKLANPTSIEDMDNDPEFLEWRAQQPKQPTPPPPNDLSPIIGAHYGFSRSQSRGMKALYRELVKTPSPDIGVIKLRRRQSTPLREIMARDFAKLAQLIPKSPTVQKSQQGNNKSATSSKRSSNTSSSTDDEDIQLNPMSFPKRLRINSSESESEAEGRHKSAKTSSICSSASTSNYPLSSKGADETSAQPVLDQLSSTTDDVVEKDVDMTGTREEDQVAEEVSIENGNKNDPPPLEPVEKNKEIPKPIAETQEHNPTANLQKLISLLANADDKEDDEEYDVDDDDDDDDGEEEEEDEEPDNSSKPPSKVPHQVIREEDQPCAEELDAPPVVWVADSEDFLNGMQPQVGVSPGTVSNQGRTSGILQIKVPPQPIFSLSGLNENEKRSITDKLTQLGGTVSETPMFDPSSFAVIANTLARSEKVLCAIASGKPIVTSAYVNECMEADEFIPITEEFIWKESDARNEGIKELAKSSFHWIHRILKDPTDTPFHGDKFFLAGKANNKFAAFGRLILSGGGRIVEDKAASTMVLVIDQQSGEVDGHRVENVAYLSDQIINPK